VLVRWQPVRLFSIEGDPGAGIGAISWGLKAPVDIPYSWRFSDELEAAS
jgi:hypothetical protein